jgi:phospholipid/cholesterol/gamma-HCH transport system substrate-binding protein
VKLQIDKAIKIPEDTSAAISSDGLLGGNYVSLSPGGSMTNLAPGASFQVTQSAINIEDLLGKFIFSMGDMNSKSGSGQSAGGSAAPSGAQTGPSGGQGGLSNPNTGASSSK